MISALHFESMRSIASAVALFGILVHAGCRPDYDPAAIDPSSTRQLPLGKIVGFTGSYGSHVWLGIPYALPPKGLRRWRAPEPARSWKGRREALEFGWPCPQIATPFLGVVDQAPGTYAGDEDCLVLNVYAPRLDTGEVPVGARRLPVMVWIHGGSNTVGHASAYDGGNLAQAQNVIVVTINYRLGPLGWFRHAALRDDAHDATEASGNFGLLDQIEALRFVRDNISGFGGDPDNVTLFGGSAGGRDVMALLLSPLAEGLFHRAISQSGSIRKLQTVQAEALVDDPEPGHPNSSSEVLARLLVRAGRARDRAGAVALIHGLSLDEIEAFLYETTPARLLRMYEQNQDEGIAEVPNLFGDGAVLPSTSFLERFATGEYNRVPIVFGTNRDEEKVFMYPKSEYVRNAMGFLPRLRDEDSFNFHAAAVSMAWKLVGADAPAAAIRRSGSEVYVYRFDWDEEPSMLGADLSIMLGASHGFEIPFVFGHYDLGKANVVWTKKNAPGRDELSGAMMSYWTQFARTGKPGRGRGEDLTEWTAWDADPGAAKFLILDTDAGGGRRMSSDFVTAERLISRVGDAGRTRSEQQRCKTYREVDEWLDYIDRSFPGVDECTMRKASAR